ncbi:M1 family aminopeptidase [Vitiosangium sp. GDMCC 1.1324]|uniref:M1 family aminopeptidase n=1 Tax=Vitiosangium sp. (strain GDMCC 1.1324) TaxID=2138576 RepID=UPI000D365DF5|nr:M1 family aminopeptidase [Vitiosangium sp. GDMCC 1.1324]PTL78494.1 aminopeptidase [Vitiosangium sp. GDMCC 1.1324]
MRSYLRRWPLLALLLVPGIAPAGDFVPPEVQFALQHLKSEERARAAQALGPLEDLPRYLVQLEVDPKARKVTGHLRVELSVRNRPLDAVHLRVTPNAFDPRVALSDVKVNGQPAKLQHPEDSLYRVQLDSPIAPGGSAVVELELEARVPRAQPGSTTLMGSLGNPGGAGGDYGAFAAMDDFVSLVGVVPLVPPLDASGNPWAGPTGVGDLALYEPSNVLANIIVPSGWKVHATGVPMGELPQKNGRIRYTFAAGAVRDFPVFASRGYQSATATVNGVTVESFFASRDVEVGRRVLKYASDALSEFERRLGPLPFKFFRVVEAPLSGGAGGMEFPGLVTVGTALYRGAGDPGSALEGMQGMGQMQQLLQAMGGDAAPFAQLGKTLERTLEFTVAHEVAHQYFAGLVGSDPINAPVVDESLAQYAALLYMEWKHGRAAAEQMRQEALVSSYHLFRLSGGKDAAADRPTSEFDDPLQYGALVYGKAPLLHHASRKLIGDEAFFKGLRSYVDTYRFKWTCGDCLTRELAKASPSNAKELERLRVHWWKETHGDEDLGQANMGALLGVGADGQELDPETKKLIEELLPGLLKE